MPNTLQALQTEHGNDQKREREIDMELNKAKLDVLIALIREYWTNNDTSIGGVKKRLDRIKEYQKSELPNEERLIEFLQTIFGLNGINTDATNENIYNALEALGKKVK